MAETETTKFEQWAIVEVMGHRRFAGMVTEQTIGGSSFVRVDVPEVQSSRGETLPAFTKLFGSGSIYCISPVSEAIARGLAAQWCERPVSVYDLPAEYRKQPVGIEQSSVGTYYDDHDDHDDRDDDDDCPM